MKCKEWVFGRDGKTHSFPCSRKAVKDGYCETHQPEIRINEQSN